MPGTEDSATVQALRTSITKNKLFVVVMANARARTRLFAVEDESCTDGVLIKPFISSSVFNGLQEVLQTQAPAPADAPSAAHTGTASVGRHILLVDDVVGKPSDVYATLATIAEYCDVASVRQPLQKPDTVRIFAPDAMLAATGNNPSTRAAVVALCKELTEQGMAPLDAVSQHLQNGDSASACRLLHKLRGSLGSVGAKPFAASASAWEHVIRADEVGAYDALQREVRVQLQAVIEAATEWLSNQAPEQPVARPSGKISPEELARFAHALAQQDMNALMDYAKLQPSLDAVMTPAAAATLAEAMSNLSFDEALAVLKDQGLVSGV